MPDVSVVIPTHDRDALLTEAIASVVGQSLRPCEVLVCDDLGSGATRSTVDSWGVSTGGLVRYVDSSHSGYTTAGASRNVGARAAHGTMLAFVDDDDLWLPNHLESLVEAMESHGCDFAVSWTESDDPTFVFARMTEGLTAKDVLSRNPGFVGSNFLIATEAFAAVDGFDPNLRVSNDQDLLVRLLESGSTYTVVGRVSVRNRIHSGEQLTDKTEARIHAIGAYYLKHQAQMGWRDRVVIGTVVTGIRRITSRRRLARLWYTGLTAVGKGVQALTGWRAP